MHLIPWPGLLDDILVLRFVPTTPLLASPAEPSQTAQSRGLGARAFDLQARQHRPILLGTDDATKISSGEGSACLRLPDPGYARAAHSGDAD